LSNITKIIIIAGPNGAGKTTFATEYLPKEADCPIFVNADLISSGLSPFQPDLVAIRSGRIMLEQIRTHVEREESFAFETTLSGLCYVGMIRRWQEKGYLIKLFFLKLPSVEMAVARVRQRVLEDIIQRRFDKGWYNWEHLYRNLVDEWALYDNSGSNPVLLAEKS
jgi:predicted ABC-type ATPase